MKGEPIVIRKLNNGRYQIEGLGPCNWASLNHWPATLEEIDEGMSPEACCQFRDVVRCVAENIINGETVEDGRCVFCGNQYGDDAYYIGNHGPFCESCYKEKQKGGNDER